MFAPRNFNHLSLLSAMVLVLLPCVFLIENASGQSKSKAMVVEVKGKLEKVEKKGRSWTLVVKTAEGELKSFPISGRVNFGVEAPADEGFLTKGSTISTAATMFNKQLFTKKLTVHVGKGKKPAGKVVKAPKTIGASINTYLVTGTIVSKEQDKEYPDYQVLMLKVGRTTGKLFLEKGLKITVRVPDVEMAKPGSDIVLQGTQRGSRFLTSKATVTLKTPFKSEDFPAKGAKRKSKKKKK